MSSMSLSFLASTNIHDTNKRRYSDAKNPADVLLEELASILGLQQAELNLSLSFVEQGGQSLSAVKLSTACRRRGCRLSVEKILKAETIAQLVRAASRAPRPLKVQPQTQNGQSPRSPVLNRSPLAVRSRRLSKSLAKVPNSPMSPMSPTFLPTLSGSQLEDVRDASLTEMQLSLIRGSLLDSTSNIISFYETYRSVDIPVIKKAWQELVRQELIFRSKVKLEGRSGKLTETSEFIFDWTETIVHSENAYEELLLADPKELLFGSSFQVIFHEPAAVGTIIWRIHHALIDGFSANLIRQKLRAILNGQAIIPGTPFTHVCRGFEALHEASKELNRQFWDKQKSSLANAAGSLALAKPSPTLSVGLQGQSVRSTKASVSIGPLLTRAKSSQVSVATLYYAAWALTLSSFADSDSVVFGTVLSGRNIPVEGATDTIGPLINTLPLSITLDQSWSTTDLLRNTFERMVELQSVHTSVPSDGFHRDFASALAMEFEIEHDENYHGPRPINQSYFKVKSDIPLSITYHLNGDIRFDYHCDKYQPRDIELLSICFQNALLMMLEPTWLLGHCCKMLTPLDDQKKVLLQGNAGRQDTFPASVEDDLVTLFEKATITNLGAPAVEKGGMVLTYLDLDRQASILAWEILRYVEEGDVICVHADRSINWIIAIYGILKAGCVYCPLDAALPPNIRKANFETAGARVFLAPALADKSFAPKSANFSLSVEELVGSNRQSRLPHRTFASPRQNAYICFTSGSTGKLKGVVCHYEGLVAFQKDVEIRLKAQPGVRISQVMSPAFDGSIHEIFSALSYGATLVLSHSVDPFAHLASVHSAILTPSVAKTLEPEDFPQLRDLYLVGDPVPQYVNDNWALQKKLYNMYGPTEATGGATIQKCVPGKPVTLGSPNPSSRVYILDRHRNLSPPGVVGEIFMAGVQVARGYIGRPEETTRRFLCDPFQEGQHMYMTGDRGFFDAAGEIVVLGRRDRQIKLRGFRCDLNDLEARVAQIQGVSAVCIAQKEDYLVAMIQPASLEYLEVKKRLADVLPVHAVPRNFALVDSFPKTSIGKLDYKKMVEMVRPIAMTVKTKPITTLTEKTICSIWQECLGLEDTSMLSVDSSFEALGGNSILQLTMSNQLTTRTHKQVPLKTIIRASTLGELATVIDALPIDAGTNIQSSVDALGETNPSPMEVEWLEKFDLKAGASSFNITFACKLGPSINKHELEKAFNVVLAHHDILRCRFTRLANGSFARTYIYNPAKVRRVQQFDAWRESNRRFDHAKDFPVFILMSDRQILINISHIVCDLTTLQKLLTEVATTYHDGKLDSCSREFFNTAWSAKSSATDLAFWQKSLSALPPSPFDSPILPATRTTYTGTTHFSKLPSVLYKRLFAFSQTQNLTLHQLALAAVAQSLTARASKTDIVLGAPYLNRSANHLDTVGLFLEPLPIRIKHDPTNSGAPFLKTVQEAAQDALSHVVPWTQLLAHLGVRKSFPSHPLMDVMVTVHDDRGSGSRLDIEGVEPLITWTTGAKFTLMCEFYAVSDDVGVLRLEYDDEIISPEQIEEVRVGMLTALECVVEGVGYEETKARLRKETAPTRWACEGSTGSFYGKALREL